ncbi:low-affinity peptide transporter [Aphelenchoides avenae]|nr:low-affinity peptide transporter [Aphelenchus avenae]
MPSKNVENAKDEQRELSLSKIVRNWPKTTFCIFSEEFCERFSYYCLRTVLTLYLVNVLEFDDATTLLVFHSTTSLAYASPLLGSIISDGYIGKFRTILYVSFIYAAGQILLTFASTLPKGHTFHPSLDLLALLLISIATGGIKPCVSAFGADQFDARQTRMISLYFSVFFFVIQIGAMTSSIISPRLRTLSCFGQDSCFPFSFGLAAALMVIAIGLFVIGSPWYTKVSPKGNMVLRVARTIYAALINKFCKKQTERKHWLDHSLDEHDCRGNKYCLATKRTAKGECAQEVLVSDVKALMRMIVMMLPIPMFWALYDQQGSRWLLQAVNMDGRITEGWTILPDQIHALNAILTIFLIPLSQWSI